MWLCSIEKYIALKTCTHLYVLGLPITDGPEGGATVLVIVEIQFNVYYIEVPSLKIVYGVKHVNHNALIIEYTDNQTFSLSSSL